jgi:hypothetical protein
MQEQNLLNKATAAKDDKAATTKRANVRVASESFVLRSYGMACLIIKSEILMRYSAR